MPDKPLVPLIHASHAKAFITLIKHFEHDIYPLLKTAGLPDTLLRQPYQFVSSTPIEHLLALMAERAEPQHYGHILRNEIKSFFIPKVLQRLRQVRTVEEALQQLTITIQHESPSTQLSIHRFNNMPWFCRCKPSTDSAHFLWAEVFSVLFIIELIRTLTRTDWLPNQIALQSSGAKELAIILNDKNITFYTGRSLAAVALNDTIMAMPFHTPAQFSQSVTRTDVPTEMSYIESVQHALGPYLAKQSLTIEEAAQRLETTPRTLQRRLASANTSFRQIKEHYLLETACRLMENHHYSLTAIAQEIGYANLAHFSRAFKKMTGFSPKCYRKRYLC
ncbi:helix-turn-helix transcriptional regulator [Photobacterium japonica]|uniref:helix-turn-helix transcriptional regulator n=1 Tax=Photobacterium japonica TaxID=2910235 RepID=UPI003D113245